MLYLDSLNPIRIISASYIFTSMQDNIYVLKVNYKTYIHYSSTKVNETYKQSIIHRGNHISY